MTADQPRSSKALADAIADWKTPATKELLVSVSGFNAKFAGTETVLKNAGGGLAAAKVITGALGPSNAHVFAKAFGAHAGTVARLKGAAGLGLTAKRLAEMFGGLSAIKVTRTWDPALSSAGKALAAFIAAQERVDEQAVDFVARHGWPVPTYLSVPAFRHVVSMAPEGKRAVNVFMVENFRAGTRSHRTAANVLLESPHFESRRPVLRQVLAAQKRRQWYLVINGLLPLVEGVLVDVTYEGETAPLNRRPQGAVQKLRETDWFSLSVVVEAIETLLLSAGANAALFGGYERERDRYGGPGEPRALNRHAILHGDARRYGTELNATKLFLLLVVIAEVLEHWERKRAAPAK